MEPVSEVQKQKKRTNRSNIRNKPPMTKEEKRALAEARFLNVVSAKLRDSSKIQDNMETYGYLIILNNAEKLPPKICKNLYVFFKNFLDGHHKDYIADNGEISFDDYLAVFAEFPDENETCSLALLTYSNTVDIVRKLVKFYRKIFLKIE